MSKLDNLPFALPDIGDEETAAVAEAMRSGWMSTGPRVREFEHAFAECLGSGLHAVSVNSATAGLHLALEAVGVSPGDEVLVPTWTFTATAEVVRYVGAEPVFVDVDPKTLNIDLEDAARRTTAATRAVMPVHFAGHPVDYTALQRFASRWGVAVVEDAAHAFPAASGKVAVGAGASDAAVFSFYATKTITTGEGGMLVTWNTAIAERARIMRLHGISKDAFDRYRSIGAGWQYDVVASGFKYNMTDPAAALGLVQLRRAEQMRTRREAIARQYTEAFADLDMQLPAAFVDGVHARHLYVVRLEHARARDNFIHRLTDAGIGTSVHFIPLHMQKYWRDRSQLRPEDFPVATREFGRVVSLPIFSAMTDSQIDCVIEAVRKVRLS